MISIVFHFFLSISLFAFFSSFHFVNKLIAIVVDNSFFLFHLLLAVVNRSIYSRIIPHIWTKLSFGVTPSSTIPLSFFCSLYQMQNLIRLDTYITRRRWRFSAITRCLFFFHSSLDIVFLVRNLFSDI
jgi:hypothetical protein